MTHTLPDTRLLSFLPLAVRAFLFTPDLARRIGRVLRTLPTETGP